MTEVTRPSLYGAQHPLILVPKEDRKKLDIENVLVAGHCCESGDLLTPEPGNPEGLLPRTMIAATIGDYLVIEGAGAYCSGMSTKNYNSFPEATEILWEQNEQARLIRKRQTLEQITQNESPYVS
jgi:diaminopimelate decarboxylase